MRLMMNACAAALAAGALTSTSSFAQEETTLASTDVIVVTSQFRQQSVLEVPLAVTAYDGDDLTELGVDEFDELSNFVPGFVVQEQSVNNPGFVLRGITSDSGASNIEPRVSVFQNGVSIARSRGSVVQLFDVERVEVLKGPQGTLFGRSAQIGAVHVITQKPTDEFEGSVTAGYGNFGQKRLEGMVNLPLVDDKLALRVAGLYNYRAGYTDNPVERDLNGTDTWSARASLRYTPAANVTVDLIANYAEDHPVGISFKSGVIPALGGDTDPNSFATLNTFGGFLDNAELGVDRHVFDVTAIVDWDINDSWNITSTTGYREFESLEVFDPDGTALDLFIFAEDAEAEQWSSDIRVSYDNGGKFTGFFGGGVFFEEGSQAVPLGLDVGNVAAFFGSLGATTGPDDNGVSLLLGNPLLAGAFLTGNPAVLDGALAAAGIPSGVFQSETFTNFADNFSIDVFGEISYEVTDRLELTVGGRYTRDDKETLFSSTVDQPNPFTPFILGGSPSLLVGETNGVISSDDQADLDNTFDGFAWRAVVNYEIFDDKFVYFNYSRGRRPEVLEDEFSRTPTGGVTGAFTVIPAETVVSYEVGAKGSFFDGGLVVDLAGYIYEYENFQTGVNVAEPGQAPDFRTLNGGTADSVGIELGLQANPIENLSFFLTYGFNKGRFDRIGPDGAEQEFGGNQFRLAPDHSLSVGMTVQYPTEYGRFFLTPTYTYKSEVFFEDANQGAFDLVVAGTNQVIASAASQSQDAYGLINLRAGADLLDDRVSLEAYVQNLADKDFIIDAGNTGGSFGIPTFIAGPPRFYGGAVTVRF